MGSVNMKSLSRKETDYIITGLYLYIKEVNKAIATSLIQSFGCNSSDTLDLKNELRKDRKLVENLTELLDTLEG